MPPTSKDFDVTSANAQTPTGSSASTGTPSADTAAKPQPVALEVPVTVNGARTVEGSDKREPFAEATQTVLVFGNGAVIRLASAVTPGQLLFLTNDKTKKEVVCQVVKSKNYRNVSGYVELEFTEAVSGFWGMRFPGERVTAQPVTHAPAAAKSPTAPPAAAPKVGAPAASNLPKRPEPQAVPAPPVRTETVTTSALKTEVKPALNLPRAADTKPAATQPKAPALPNSFGSGVTTSSRAPESKPPAPVATKLPPAPAAPVSTQASSDALKRESARLQEQLSSMLFTPEVPAKPAPPAATTPAANKPASADLASKVIEMAKQPAPSAKPVPPAKNTSLGTRSALDAEEVKIPSWLEPLARNVATPAHTEIATRDEDAHADQVIEFEVQDVSAPATTHETGIATLTPAETPLDIALPLPAEAARAERVSAKSNKGVLIGAIAAGVLLAAAGGTWYLRQPSTPAQPSAAAAAIPPATSSAPAAQPPAKRAVEVPSASSANVSSASAATPPAFTASQVNAQPATPTAQPVKTALQRSAAAELSAYKKLAEPQPEPPVQPQSKKPSLGEVHLAAPEVTRRAATPDNGAADLAPALNAGQVSSAGDALGGGLAAGSGKQPTAPPAPLPVGGDVQQARLVASTPPTYPAIAKSQHVQGDVRIDALIDANGRVSSMKIVAGPVLLHQAAMDAVRQWKYQAATLDGKPVPMHLTVTVQFRLQ
jgi:TonB family protein